MKIFSREPGHVGEGQFTLKMDFEELEFLASVLYITRMGKGVYQQAALKLMGTISDVFGDDFFEDSALSVDLYVSRLDEDDGDTIIEQFHNGEISLEV